MDDSENDSELEIEDEHEEDVIMDDSDHAESSDNVSLASSTSLSSSDSSSSDGEMKVEEVSNFETEQTCKEVDLSKLSCDDRADPQAPPSSSTSLDTPVSSTTAGQGTSKGVFFKKIDRRNKNYKQRSHKRHRKVCKNKRQRKS